MTSYRPNEDERSIKLERYSLAGDLLCGVAYGTTKCLGFLYYVDGYSAFQVYNSCCI